MTGPFLFNELIFFEKTPPCNLYSIIMYLHNYVHISRKTNDKDPTVFNLNLLKHESFDDLKNLNRIKFILRKQSKR